MCIFLHKRSFWLEAQRSDMTKVTHPLLSSLSATQTFSEFQILLTSKHQTGFLPPKNVGLHNCLHSNLKN